MRGKPIVWTWIIAMLLTSLAVMGITTSPSMPIVAVEPMSNTGSVGDSFTVDINVYDVTDLYGWDVRIDYNKDVIQATGVARGPFLETAGLTAWYLWDLTHPGGPPWPVIDNTVGIVIAGDSLVAPLPEDGATGSGTLFSITFTIVADGVSPIHFDLSSLVTVISGTSVDIEHTSVSGLFDNRVANTLPVAMFTGPLTGVVGQPYTFTSTSYDPDGWIVSEDWDFGDGENDTGTVVSHTFASAGIYTVTLTVTDGPDGETKSATADIDIQIWMEGGWIPDLVPYYAKPAHPDLNEANGDRTLDILGKVGNPTEEDYEVYVEFALFSKDEVAFLGNLDTDVYTIAPGEIVVLSAEYDSANPQWRCFSGGYWVIYGYVHWRMHKYIGFATCYSRPVGTEEWTEGYVRDYLSFHVKSVTHDIGILDMWANVTKPTQGDPVSISMNVTNEGAMQETFTVSINYKDVTIDEIPVTLDPGEIQELTTIWDTTLVPVGAYVVNAELPLLTFERDATDQSDYVVIRVQ